MCVLFGKKEGVVIKKLICLIMSVFIIIPLMSCCREDDENKINSDKLSIVATIFPYYDFSKQIAGDNAEVTMLIPPGSEPHDFEPSPQDIIKINQSDIFIYNGGESDEWVEDILSSIDSNVKVMRMFDYVTPLYEEDIEHNKGDEYDEHIWTSPANACKMAKAISEEIISVDSKNAGFYKESKKKYISNLNELDSLFKSADKNSLKKPLIFADRFPILYFVKEYNLNYESAFPGCSSETQPSIKRVMTLIDYVKNNNVSVIFHIDNSNKSLANLISDDTGAKVITFYSCHNITKEQFENGETYISLMEINLKSVKEAIN